MKEYHKINAPFKRNNDGDKKLIIGDWALPEFAYLQYNDWIWTEKVDGTNIRVQVQYDMPQDLVHIAFKGRTDRAEIPPTLLEALHDQFDNLRFRHAARLLMEDHGINNVTLYGEGYGPKIQGGGKYRKDPGFVLFDVNVGGWWLLQDDVDEVGLRLGVDTVPIILEGTIGEAIQAVQSGYVQRGCSRIFLGEDGYLPSEWGEFEAEGLVGTPSVPLFNRKGDRIITKVKARDFR